MGFRLPWRRLVPCRKTDAVFYHTVDVGGTRNIVERVRFQDDEIGEFAGRDRADLRAGFAAESLGGVGRSRIAGFASELSRLLS